MITKFNFKHYIDGICLICDVCNREFAYGIKRCSYCYNNIFKVSNRTTGVPAMLDMDKIDPYLRQKKNPISPNDGSGHNLTRADDEEWQGAGFGGRAREGFPDGISGNNPGEYAIQDKKSLPGSYDYGEIDVPGDLAAERSYDLHMDFMDSTDPLSRRKYVEDNVSKGPNSGSIGEMLRNQTGPIERSNPFISDSIFNYVRTRQKGRPSW